MVSSDIIMMTSEAENCLFNKNWGYITKPVDVSLFTNVFIPFPAPSPPVGLTSKVLYPGIVRLNWRPPEEANGVIVSYIIMYNVDKDQPEVFWLKKLQNGEFICLIFLVRRQFQLTNLR
jgi:hypothetical protein